MLTLILLLLKILAPHSVRINYCYSALQALFRKIPLVQKFFPFSFILFLAIIANAQTLHHEYNIVRQNEIIGYIAATKTTMPHGCNITIESKTTISILIDFTINVFQFNKYLDGRLTEALFIQSLNGRRKIHNTLQWGLNGYAVQKDGRSVSLDNTINYSVACMYFEEPGAIQKVFSENHLTMLPLRKVALHSYELQLPDGHMNYYTYEDGVLVHAKLNTKFTSVDLVFKQSK